MKKEKHTAALLLLGGFGAGFVNGLLGAGGGIIIVYLLSYLAKRRRAHSSPDGSFTALSQHDILANALCIMFPISVVSCTVYFLRGNIVGSQISFFIIPAVFGGVIGGIALPHIKAELLRKIFSLLVIISGMILAIR